MIDVFVLDGNDVPNSEDMAMIQAMYSRSPAPVTEHLEKVKKSGSGKFMGTYYLGYSHESIGELGDTHIFIEGCSMAAAKAIQDDPLYRGQEVSTRYIDFSTQPFFDPVGNSHIQELWRELYIEALPLVLKYVTKKYSKTYMIYRGSVPTANRDKIYEKTCKAAAFDICRGLLPIGATTSVAWATDLRTAKNHLNRMSIHPLAEVRDIAIEVMSALREKYPNSFPAVGFDTQNLAEAGILFDPYYKGHEDKADEVTVVHCDGLGSITTAMLNRKILPYWPRELKYAAEFEILSRIDYASYRDLQRHRNGYTSLSVPGTVNVLHPWYMDELTAACGDLFRQRVLNLMTTTENFIAITDMNLYDDQYYYPMMIEVPVKLRWNLGQVLYAFNLRSGVSVHPTLRASVKQWAEEIESSLGVNRKLFSLDPRLDYQNTTRGLQDITSK